MGDQTEYNTAGDMSITRLGSKARPMPGRSRGVSEVDRAVAEQMRQREEEERQTVLDAQVEAKLALIESYGDDVYPDGQVFSFDKRYPDSEHRYAYAGIKAANVWYLTGIQGKRFNWSGLVTWLVSDHPVKPDNITWYPLRPR
jgi:hypothetical protein